MEATVMQAMVSPPRSSPALPSPCQAKGRPLFFFLSDAAFCQSLTCAALRSLGRRFSRRPRSGWNAAEEGLTHHVSTAADGSACISILQAQAVTLHPPSADEEGEEDTEAPATRRLPSSSPRQQQSQQRPTRRWVLNVDGENKVVQGSLDARCLAREMPVFAPTAAARAR
jgi:hypothetical protein